jgi:hypothetical protein
LFFNQLVYTAMRDVLIAIVIPVHKYPVTLLDGEHIERIERVLGEGRQVFQEVIECSLKCLTGGGLDRTTIVLDQAFSMLGTGDDTQDTGRIGSRCRCRNAHSQGVYRGLAFARPRDQIG